MTKKRVACFLAALWVAGQIVAWDIGRLGPILRLAAHQTSEMDPSVAYSPREKQFFVAWSEYLPTCVRGRIVGLDGSLSPPRRYSQVSNSPTNSIQDLKVLYSSTENNFLLLWLDREHDLHSRIVSPDGISPASQLFYRTRFTRIDFEAIYHPLLNEYVVICEKILRLDKDGKLISTLPDPWNLRIVGIVADPTSAQYFVFGSRDRAMFFGKASADLRPIGNPVEILSQDVAAINPSPAILFRPERSELLYVFQTHYQRSKPDLLKSVRIDARGAKLVAPITVSSASRPYRVLATPDEYWLLFNSSEQLYLQKLDLNGKPLGQKILIAAPAGSPPLFPYNSDMASTIVGKRLFITWDNTEDVFFRYFNGP